MPTDSNFTDLIEAHFRANGESTVAEYGAAAGMSRQAAYQRRDRNSWRMRRAGKGRTGADRWILLGVTPGTVAPPPGAQVASDLPVMPDGGGMARHVTGRWSGPMPGLTVGDCLTVRSIRLSQGAVMVDLDTSDGDVLSVEVGAGG